MIRLHLPIAAPCKQALPGLADSSLPLKIGRGRNRLPEIPIGGAREDPQTHADWDAFDKWIHLASCQKEF